MLPSPYDRWASAVLGREPPEETRATCDACPMTVGPPFSAWALDPVLRCCIDVPELPSFRAGRVLADPDPALARGRAALGKRIEARVGVSPLGLLRSEWEEHRRASEDARRGLARDLACPYHLEDTGACGIHPHRNAGCSTWFCRHDHGAFGAAGWAALRDLFLVVEPQIALWCALELGLPDEALRAAIGEPGSRVSPDGSEQAAERLWGPWRGREKAWYLACAERAADLGWDEVLRICGPEVAARARLARERWDAISAPGLPERLRVARFEVLAVGEAGAMVTTYGPHDPIGVPAALLGVLHAFDGRPTPEVLGVLERDRGLAIEPALLRQLVEWGLLG